MSGITAIRGISPSTYICSTLHGEEAIWVEKNCYGDVWIELLHALRLDPLAILAFTLSVDFEGDQWTFFKPSQEDLRELYGIDVQELTVWRPLLDHAMEHIGAGKLISTEADAFWLPDTSGTDYRANHVKTTIILTSLDVEAQRLGYFHNAGYFELSGEDFIETFRLNKAPDPTFLPLFAEVIRIDRVVHRSRDELATMAWQLLQRHLGRRPVSNPFVRFWQRFAKELPNLQANGLGYYHAWAFASIRQAGAAFDLAATHLRWQAQFNHPELIEPATCLSAIAQANKALILKGARAVNSGRPLDSAPLFSDMENSWDRAMELLNQCV